MIEKIMLYVLPGLEGAAAVCWALKLARRLGARVFAVHVIEPADDTNIEEQEEEAWKILYEVEDDAFETDVKLSLVLEQGDPVTRFVELGTSYSGDLVVVPAGSFRPEDLVARSPVPVVFVREFKEET